MANSTRYHLGLLFLRVGVSALMLTHGIPKLINLVTGNLDFGDPIGLGPTTSLILTVIGEAICPMLVIIGFKTRWAAIPPAITMLVAAFVVHASDPIATKEKAILFLITFLVIALLGAGKYAVDKK